ncbi:MAG: VCBS repeat-containing protein, partial [Bacteroidota bacterium]
MRVSTVWLFLLVLTVGFSCHDSTSSSGNLPSFQLLRQSQTGLSFQNSLEQSVDFNAFNYMYFFNGGGLAAGDFNQDGLIDLYFTSNMGANALYLNQGDLQFKEVTELAGVE